MWGTVTTHGTVRQVRSEQPPPLGAPCARSAEEPRRDLAGEELHAGSLIEAVRRAEVDPPGPCGVERVRLRGDLRGRAREGEEVERRVVDQGGRTLLVAGRDAGGERRQQV